MLIKSSFIKYGIVLSIMFFVLISCASQENFVEQGGRLLSQKELTELYKGNTFKGHTANGGQYTVHYSDDGKKLIKLRNQVTERKWWVNDQGEFCETLYRDSSQSCGPKIYILDDTYRSFNDNGFMAYEFKLVDPEKGDF